MSFKTLAAHFDQIQTPARLLGYYMLIKQSPFSALLSRVMNNIQSLVKLVEIKMHLIGFTAIFYIYLLYQIKMIKL